MESLETKYVKGIITDKEAKRLLARVSSSPEAAEAFRRKCAQIASHLNADVDTQAQWDRLVERCASDFARKPIQRRRWFRTLSGFTMAAAVAALAFFFLRPEPVQESGSAVNVSTPVEYITAVGERLEYMLPDGTSIIQNADTRITLAQDFTSGAFRKLEIDGEAFFNVASDPTRPFIISTCSGEYQVLGTSFNICSFGADRTSIVTLHTGRLQAKVNNDVIVLEVNQELMVNNECSEISKKEVNVENSVAWMNDQIVFSKMPLRDIADRFSRFYHIKVEVSEDVADLQFSGKVSDEPIETALKYIAATSAVALEVSFQNDGYLITK